MTDIWTKSRAKGLHRESFPDEERPADTPGAVPVPPPQPTVPSRDVHEALQMLTLAQRTADEHVAGARRQAEKVHADARAAADQIAREAQGRAEAIRREADKALSDARAQAAQIAHDAQVRAEGLERQAEQRYEEMVGNLVVKREALQQQIEALQEFDRDYRSRLLTFMQAQLRALWVDEPQVDGEIEQPGGPRTTRLRPAPEAGSAGMTEPAPAKTGPADQS